MLHFLCIIYILSIKPSSDEKEISIKEKIKNEIANDVFIPNEYNDKGILFLNQVKIKRVISLNMRSELQIMYMSHQETGGFFKRIMII